jgi:hypothetical protein
MPAVDPAEVLFAHHGEHARVRPEHDAEPDCDEPLDRLRAPLAGGGKGLGRAVVSASSSGSPRRSWVSTAAAFGSEPTEIASTMLALVRLTPQSFPLRAETVPSLQMAQFAAAELRDVTGLVEE